MKPVALFPADREAPELDCEVVRIELKGLRLRRARQWGACWLALVLWCSGSVSARAALPEVVEAVAEYGAAQGQDGVGAVDGPVHAAALEAAAADVPAAALDDAGGDAQPHGAERGIAHPPAVARDVVGALAGLLEGCGMAAQSAEDVTDSAAVEFVAALLAPFVGEIGAGAEDGLRDLEQRIAQKRK